MTLEDGQIAGGSMWTTLRGETPEDPVMGLRGLLSIVRFTSWSSTMFPQYISERPAFSRSWGKEPFALTPEQLFLTSAALRETS